MLGYDLVGAFPQPLVPDGHVLPATSGLPRDADAEHCLIIDRTAGHASVAPIAVAQEFLRSYTLKATCKEQHRS
jgi:hypothetical protein